MKYTNAFAALLNNEGDKLKLDQKKLRTIMNIVHIEGKIKGFSIATSEIKTENHALIIFHISNDLTAITKNLESEVFFEKFFNDEPI